MLRLPSCAAFGFVMLAALGCGSGSGENAPASQTETASAMKEHAAPSPEDTAMALTLTSPVFEHEGSIPALYTCDDKDISPELRWNGVPAGAQSLVLIVDDPDAPDPAAPKMTWVHWVLYNIPVTAGGLAVGIAPDDLPEGTLEGTNDWKRTGYGGPCPPIGRHRYYHKLYALDTVLDDLGEPTKAEVEQAMAGHVLAETVLMGTYQRPR